MIEYYNPESVGDFTAAGLSSGTGTDELVFAPGLAIDDTTMKRRASAVTIADEVAACFDNIDAILAEAGLSRSDIVKTTCFLQEEEYRMEFVGAYKSMFGDGPYPARNTFVLGIASDCRVQIETIAVRPASR
ncbi:hypothetical protein nbrc107696_22440 [Gordonia spumicola]|uniref:Enamine deaminase RidA n=1 Tax=Gordonia spumicola TaxID=589161 RepID=A0A7I9V8S3_9ACTN|nr:RidA family protein [Gordonia spumicola]GEE01642.1 hypothetical protein nbrc107696_20880 [Gordonia spumicola]GEE01798.1 hypothetical protein nbrc107696_22440 [Gordonia spumicola]